MNTGADRAKPPESDHVVTKPPENGPAGAPSGALTDRLRQLDIDPADEAWADLLREDAAIKARWQREAARLKAAQSIPRQAGPRADFPLEPIHCPEGGDPAAAPAQQPVDLAAQVDGVLRDLERQRKRIMETLTRRMRKAEREREERTGMGDILRIVEEMRAEEGRTVAAFLAEDPDARVRELLDGIRAAEERTAQLVADLEQQRPLTTHDLDEMRAADDERNRQLLAGIDAERRRTS